MKNQKNSECLPEAGVSSLGHRSLIEALKEWRKSISYFSIFTAVPSLIVGSSQGARAEDVTTHSQTAPSQLGNVTKRHRIKPRFLGPPIQSLGYSNNSVLTGLVMAGSDNCPGTAIPAGTYTAGAPYTDTGDTTGANDTVTRIPGYYYYYDSDGPDQVYSFVVNSFGADPKITVTTTSPTYRPMIYVTDGCPSGVGNTASYPWAIQNSRWNAGSNIAEVQVPYLQLGRRYYAFVDSSEATDGGAYTLTVKDMQISSRTAVRANHPDFDGDGKTDISVWRPSEGNWYILQSLSQSMRIHGWGLAGDKLAPADFDGDGKTDLAVFRENEGNWYIVNSATNTVSVASWGIPGDLVMPADYNGDLKADLAVYRPSNGKWYRRDSDGKLHVFSLGVPGDKPIGLDFWGNGRAQMTVFRPSQAKWYMFDGLGNGGQIEWGQPGDIPVPGNYSGRFWSGFAVYRPSNQTWYIQDGADGYPRIVTWGLPGDIPAPGDYDGDGETDLAVFRPSNSTWYIFGSTAGIYTQPFGLTGDVPVPNAFVY